MKGIGE